MQSKETTQSREKTAYERFVDAFAERYKEELKYVGLVPEEEMLRLFCEFKARALGKMTEQWFEQQELS
jgi:hypothetical protein